MDTPSSKGNKSNKSKRVHLSPLSTYFDGNVAHVRVRGGGVLNSDLDKSLKPSCSLHNLSLWPENGQDDNGVCPRVAYEDRYIPRHIRDLPMAQSVVNGLGEDAEKHIKSEKENLVGGVEAKYEALRCCVSEPELSEDRILSFTRPAPQAFNAGVSKAVEFVRNTSTKPRWKLKRYVPKVPERVLDAPDLLDDYYLNLLHWGGNNSIAIGLGKVVYVWNSSSGSIDNVGEELDADSTDYVSSVQWSGNSSNSCLTIGYSSGVVKLYDVNANSCLRTFNEPYDRVPSLSWNESILTRGSRSGVVFNYDVRMQHALVSKLRGFHSQEVCGLTWSYDGTHLATGGNDNQAYVWSKAGALAGGPCIHNFNTHSAAVKAVSWNPRERNVLATGGGTADRSVNFWNVFNGTLLSTVTTNSQVSGIIWNPFADEFVTSHGHPQNHLTLWSYPSTQVAAHLLGHMGRILSISLSNDGTTVASLGADETLRLWKCFEQPRKGESSATGHVGDKRSRDIH